MENLTNPVNVGEKLEDFLRRACEAEAKADYRDANRLFRLALYCEGKLRPGVGNTKKYVQQAGEIYPEDGGLKGKNFNLIGVIKDEKARHIKRCCYG